MGDFREIPELIEDFLKMSIQFCGHFFGNFMECSGISGNFLEFPRNCGNSGNLHMRCTLVVNKTIFHKIALLQTASAPIYCPQFACHNNEKANSHTNLIQTKSMR